MKNLKLLTLCSVSVMMMAGATVSVAQDSRGLLQQQLNTPQRPMPEPLKLRPVFEHFKLACILQAPRIAKEKKLDLDATAEQLCGCAASHAQVTGVSDEIMGQLVDRMAKAQWDEVGDHEDYEYILEYCLQDEYD